MTTPEYGSGVLDRCDGCGRQTVDSVVSAAAQESDYVRGYTDGYAAAIKEVQREFTPLWQAVQQAVGRSHALDSFIIERRRTSAD